VVLASLEVAAASLAEYRAQDMTELDSALQNGYGDGYRGETRTTNFDN
jgi:hypothetical protein